MYDSFIHVNSIYCFLNKGREFGEFSMVGNVILLFFKNSCTTINKKG
jgi:hypothetical protein